MRLAGGCLCGAVRYEFEGTPGEAGWCHCRMCQRSSGAPAQTYVLLAVDGFRYIGTEPSLYRSSETGERRFCPDCGSQIEFRNRTSPEWISLNSGTLDDPSVAPPDRHIWTSSEVAWFRESGGLQRFAKDC